MITRWIAAAVSLGLGGAVTAAVFWFGSPSRDQTEVAFAARDVAAGAPVGDAIAFAPMPAAHATNVFTRHDASGLASLSATHALSAGQLIQRSDVAPPPQDSRLVFLPLKDVPALEPGAHVDLLVVGPDGSVQPFASGIDVRESSTGGLVVAVTSRQAAAFVYAAEAMHLVAVIAEPGVTSGSEVPVASPDQAMQIAAQP